MDDDTSSRLRNLEQDHRELRSSHTALRVDYEEFKQTTQRNMDRLESVVNSIRDEMKQIGERLTSGLEKVNSSLNNVTSSALQSLPQWAQLAMERKSTLITVLTALATAFLGLAGAVIAILVTR